MGVILLAFVGLWAAAVALSQLTGPSQKSLVPVAEIVRDYASPGAQQRAWYLW